MKQSLIFVSILLAMNFNTQGQSITIAAAADLRNAMGELVKIYKETNSDVKIDPIFGASGNFYQQITNKAPFDIFFSADHNYAVKLKEQGLTVGEPKVYAIGHLVLWSSTLDVSKGMDLLKSNKVRKIAIANPEIAPYGKRAVECITYYKLDQVVKDKIVKGDNVSQAAQFVLTGNAEVGLIALSLALSPEMSAKGKYFLIDQKSYSQLDQSFVILKQAENNKEVLKFVKFLDTDKARKVFSKHGFNLPKQ
jgi:molybdate transport system substrate-binding protein